MQVDSERSRTLPRREIADGVWCLGPWGWTLTAVYLIRSTPGWTLVDAGWVGDGERIADAVARITDGDAPVGVLLTHAHPDHEGDAASLARRWGCSVWLSPGELPIACRDFAAMTATAMPLDRWVVLPVMRLLGRRRRERVFARSTLEPVARAFDPASGVPGLPDWRCVPTPGHTAGHLAFVRPRDRVAICGDALLTVHQHTIRDLIRRRRGLSQPPWYTTWDAAEARRSILTLSRWEPSVVASGHGEPLAGALTSDRVRAFAAATTRVGATS